MSMKRLSGPRKGRTRPEDEAWLDRSANGVLVPMANASQTRYSLRLAMEDRHHDFGHRWESAWTRRQLTQRPSLERVR